MEEFARLLFCADLLDNADDHDDCTMSRRQVDPRPLSMQSDYCDEVLQQPQAEPLLPPLTPPRPVPDKVPNLRLGKGVDTLMLKFGPTLASSAAIAQGSPVSVVTAGDEHMPPFGDLVQHKKPEDLHPASPAASTVDYHTDNSYLGFFGQF